MDISGQSRRSGQDTVQPINAEITAGRCGMTTGHTGGRPARVNVALAAVCAKYIYE